MSLELHGANALQPVAPSERIEAIDILRGLTLFGILVVNFASPTMGNLIAQGTTADAIASTIVNGVFHGKSYPIFSFLFGVGMAIQLARGEAQGGDARSILLRRMGVLFLLGLVHTIFVWSGDVLRTYALFGLVVLMLRGLPDVVLVPLAGVLLVMPEFHSELADFLRLSPLPESRVVGPLAEELYASSYAEMIQARLSDLARHTLYFRAYLSAADMLGLLLLGFYAGRKKVFLNLTQNLHIFRMIFWLGIVSGLAVLCWRLVPEVRDMDLVQWILNVGVIWALIAACWEPMISLWYVSIIIPVACSGRGNRLLRPFGFVGRMALTNYVAQTVTGAAVFYGLGLHGKVGYTAGLLGALSLYSVQTLFSSWWLKKYRFGPLEWCWRSLTYLRLQPMRLTPSP